MRIQLEQIRLEPYRWSEVLHIPAERLDNSEILHLGEVAWQGEIRYAAPGFRLTGSIEYEQTVQCMRCLEPVSMPLRSELDLTIFIDAEDVGPGEHELDSSDLGVVYSDSELFDVEPVLFEQLQLNVPMGTVCRDDCQGLCPFCGRNRNLEECECGGDPTDPRWAELVRLRGELDRGSRE